MDSARPGIWPWNLKPAAGAAGGTSSCWTKKDRAQEHQVQARDAELRVAARAGGVDDARATLARVVGGDALAV